MRLAPEISVRALAGNPAMPARCALYIDGLAAGQPLDGAVLEGAVEHQGHYLLLLTDDVPGEDALSIHLIDNQGRLLDSARLGAMYATGAFSALRLEEPGTVAFRFIGDTDWRVELFSQARLQWPLVGVPRGVTRPWQWQRWFRVSGQPRPAR